jgi:hypothetical protein
MAQDQIVTVRTAALAGKITAMVERSATAKLTTTRIGVSPFSRRSAVLVSPERQWCFIVMVRVRWHQLVSSVAAKVELAMFVAASGN